MKCGSLVLASAQGLGYLAKSFWDAGILTDVCVVRHGKRHTHEDWFPGQPVISDFRRQRREIFEWAAKLDAFVALETPFLWELFPHCREHGVRTYLVPMYECEPRELPARPDKFLNPSALDAQYFPGPVLPIPVEVPWRLREKAETFVHNAGNLGLRGRNGTREVLEAWRYVKSPARLILRSQESMFGVPNVLTDPRLSIDLGTLPFDQLWSEGDVFLFPEKFNGLSLPLQEARAAGMLVMCGDRFPMNTWLPREPLIPVTGYMRARVAPSCLEFDEAIVDPRDIARTVDAWYGRDVREYSLSGREWAETMSWAALEPKWRDALCS